LRTASAFPPAPSVWSRTGSAGPRVRADGYWQAGNLTRGRRTPGMPSMRTRRCGTSRALRGCPPTWFAASSPSPGTGGRATAAQTSRTGGALDRRAARPVAQPRRHRRYGHGQVISGRTRVHRVSTGDCSQRIRFQVRAAPRPSGTEHRARGAVRPVPFHPALTRYLRGHIGQFGTAPDGRLYRGGDLSESVYGRVWQGARLLAF